MRVCVCQLLLRKPPFGFKSKPLETNLLRECDFLLSPSPQGRSTRLGISNKSWPCLAVGVSRRPQTEKSTFLKRGESVVWSLVVWRCSGGGFPFTHPRARGGSTGQPLAVRSTKRQASTMFCSSRSHSGCRFPPLCSAG